MRTITIAEIINDFLQGNNLKPYDLADYLEYEHGYSCYKDEKYDDFDPEV